MWPSAAKHTRLVAAAGAGAGCLFVFLEWLLCCGLKLGGPAVVAEGPLSRSPSVMWVCSLSDCNHLFCVMCVESVSRSYSVCKRHVR